MDNNTAMIEAYENKWMNGLHKLTPSGFHIKFNGQGAALKYKPYKWRAQCQVSKITLIIWRFIKDTWIPENNLHSMNRYAMSQVHFLSLLLWHINSFKIYF